jgi:hypothetical protein
MAIGTRRNESILNNKSRVQNKSLVSAIKLVSFVSWSHRKNSRMKNIFVLSFLFIFSVSYANIQLPAVLGSNMVLQQQSTVRLWGWAAPAEMIYITTSWNNKTDSVKTTRDANWQMVVQTPAAGGPYSITFKGNNTITLENVHLKM